MSIKLRCTLLLVVVLYGTALLAQPGEWGDLFSYYQSQGIAYNQEECVNYTKNTLLRYNFQTGERTKLSKIHGLSDANILHVSLSRTGELWICYASGRVEYQSPNGEREVYTGMEDEVIHGLRNPIFRLQSTDQNSCIGISKDYVYYFANGILQNQFRLWGKNQATLELTSIAAYKGKIFVGTSNGVYASGTSVDDSNYQKYGTLNGRIYSLAADASHLVALRTLSVGYDLWSTTLDGTWTSIAARPNNLEHDISLSNGRIIVSESTDLVSIKLDGSEELLHTDALLPTHSQLRAVYAFYAPDGRLYVASKHRGLLRSTGTENFEALAPTSPAFVGSSHVLPITATEVVITNNEMHASSPAPNQEFPLFFYQTGAYEGINVYWTKPVRVTDVVLLDAQLHQFAIATEDAGILIFEKEQLISQITADNSPLPRTSSGTTANLNALTVGTDGALYICAGAAGELFRRTSDGTMTPAPLPRLYAQAKMRLLFSPKKILFLSSDNQYEVVAIDPDTFFASNGKKGIASQNLIGEYMYHLVLPRDMSFDSEGALWIATEEGVVRARNPEQLLEGRRITFNGVFIHTPQDGQSALFEKTRLDHLELDAGNRLWINSPNKGIMLVDPQRRLWLAEHLSSNSPLPSNGINDMKFEPQRGLLYIATDNGTISLITTAKEAAKTFNDVRIYPNPVRPDFTGLLTIDGLLNNSYVKILDSGSELVRELQSNGGRVTWDLRNGDGKLVASGVYFALISHEATKQSYATKFVVVR